MSRLIDADALRERLQNLAYDDWNQGITTSFSDACYEIIDIIEEQPTIEPEQQWISCSERMPEEDNCTGSGVQYSDDVLITVINTMDEETVIDYGRTTDGEWYSETTDCFIPHGWKPIAWMPLPEPYAERRQDE